MAHRDDSGTKKSPSRLYDAREKPVTGRVLVVEPDPDIARMLEVRLAREGHEVLVADTAKTALEVSKGERLDCALVDRGLNDMSGFELVEQLRQKNKPFEAILMSVDPTPEITVKALEIGAFDLVVKPFSNLKIVTIKVRIAIAKARAERDRDELARMLAAQTKDLVDREAETERVHVTPNAAAGQMVLEEEIAMSSIDFDGMSGVDPLTGLPNRRAADDRFRKETARSLRYDRPLCIALASVDGLDTVIDRFGAQGADGVLRGIASMFSGMIRDVDFCARRQGGEFFFLFPETPKDNGFVVIDRIRQALAQTSFSEFLGSGRASEASVRLTASFGVAGLPTDTMNADILREAAEIALAQAKTSGDRVVLFDEAMLHHA